LCCQARAFGAQWVLDHLNHQFLTLLQQFSDRWGLLGLAMLIELGMARQDVIGVQEGRALQADIDEGSLHARQDTLDPTHVDIANLADIVDALQIELLQQSVFDHSHTAFGQGHVDQNFVAHAAPANGIRQRIASSTRNLARAGLRAHGGRSR
jgi:hypothetical protein